MDIKTSIKKLGITDDERIDALADLFDNMNDDDCIECWNEYCDFILNGNYKIYTDPDDIVDFPRDWYDLMDIVEDLDSDFDPNDSYFYTDKSGTLYSDDSTCDIVDVGDMATAIVEGRWTPQTGSFWNALDNDNETEE